MSQPSTATSRHTAHCAGFTEAGHPCGSRPLRGGAYCGRHERRAIGQQLAPEAELALMMGQGELVDERPWGFGCEDAEEIDAAPKRYSVDLLIVEQVRRIERTALGVRPGRPYAFRWTAPAGCTWRYTDRLNPSRDFSSLPFPDPTAALENACHWLRLQSEAGDPGAAALLETAEEYLQRRKARDE